MSALFERVACEEVFDEESSFEATTYSDRETWLAGRGNGIGASEAAAALGLSPYDSPYSLWSRKVGLSGSGPESRAMRRGNVMEPFVASEYELETGRKLLDLGRWTVCRSRQHTHLTCTPDRIIAPIDKRGPGLLEIKSVTNRDAWTRGTIPEHYRVQVMTSLAVLGYRWAVLAGYVAGTDEIVPVEIALDEDQVSAIVDGTAELWRSVLLGRAALARGEQPTEFPDPDASEATIEALRQRYREEINQDAVPTLDGLAATALAADWAMAADAYKRAKVGLDDCKVRAMMLVGERPEVLLPDGSKVTWKTVSRREHVVAASSTRELRRYAGK